MFSFQRSTFFLHCYVVGMNFQDGNTGKPRAEINQRLINKYMY